LCKKSFLVNKKRDIIEFNPDYIVISNDTNQHYEFINLINKNLKKKIILVEKPVSGNFFKFKEKNKNKFFVNYNLRFHPGIIFLKNQLKDKKGLFYFTLNTNSFLPSWRKNIEYKKSYSANRKRGGGVLLDLSHEIDLLLWLFKKPIRFNYINKKVSNLKISSDDIFILNGKITNKTYFSINLNYFSRFQSRTIILNFNNYDLKIDLLNFLVEKRGPNIKFRKKMKKVNRFENNLKIHKKIVNKDFKDICRINEGLEVLKLIHYIKKINSF
jgi:CMP-N,N'-diacetyllegionaminic acid synthase